MLARTSLRKLMTKPYCGPGRPFHWVLGCCLSCFTLGFADLSWGTNFASSFCGSLEISAKTAAFSSEPNVNIQDLDFDVQLEVVGETPLVHPRKLQQRRVSEISLLQLNLAQFGHNRENREAAVLEFLRQHQEEILVFQEVNNIDFLRSRIINLLNRRYHVFHTPGNFSQTVPKSPLDLVILVAKDLPLGARVISPRKTRDHQGHQVFLRDAPILELFDPETRDMPLTRIVAVHHPSDASIH